MEKFKDFFVKKVEYEAPIFEASDALKKAAAELIKGDKEAARLKKAAVKNPDAVPDYLDYVYLTYEAAINQLSKKYKADFDEIAQVLISL